MLVGGTALSGFYAGHRRSDDLDLFVKDDGSFKATRLAVKSLTRIGAEIVEIQNSNQYFNAVSALDGHRFTVDIVLDENLFVVGDFHMAKGNIVVADLPTLLKTKAAALLSRCGEKDLYDLIWLLDEFNQTSIGELIELGSEVDAGMDAEFLLFNISNTELRQDACNFAIGQIPSPKEIFSQITEFKKKLIQNLQAYLENVSPPVLGEVVKRLKRF